MILPEDADGYAESDSDLLADFLIEHDPDDVEYDDVEYDDPATDFPWRIDGERWELGPEPDLDLAAVESAPLQLTPEELEWLYRPATDEPEPIPDNVADMLERAAWEEAWHVTMRFLT